MLLLLAGTVMAADLHRGINLTNWFRFPASTDPAALQSHISDKTLAELRAAGFDFVRLAVDPAVVERPAQRDALVAAIRRIQHQGFNVVVSPHPHDWHLETNPADRASLQAFWQDLSAGLRSLDPARTVPEVLNEPVFPGDPAGWASMQHNLLATIRQNLPVSTVILTGQDWGSIGGLLALKPENDPNVLYSFHFYDPVELTSLAAYRRDVDRSALARLAFPATNGCQSKAGDEATRGVIRYYCALGWNAARIETTIGKAAAWARANNVHLLAGEFGATTELNVTARLNWITTVRTALEANHIAWALWGYEDSMGFGISPATRPRLDPALLGALGLHTSF